MNLRTHRMRNVSDTTLGELIVALYESAAEMSDDSDERSALVYAALCDFARKDARKNSTSTRTTQLAA